MDSVSALQNTRTLLSSAWSTCKPALHFVAVRKPKNQVLSYVVRAARLTYLAGVITGVATTLIICVKCDKNDLDAKGMAVLTGIAISNLVPGVGLFWAGLVIKESIRWS